MVLFVQYEQATEHNLNISLIKQTFLSVLKGMERYVTGKTADVKRKERISRLIGIVLCPAHAIHKCH